MTDSNCEKISELLVDFADGLLTADESKKVSDHLTKCRDCQKLLQALQRSLKLTVEIWQDNLSDVSVKPVKLHYLRYAELAASVLILLSISFLMQRTSKPVENEMTFAQIEQSINEAAGAARLLAATDYLAKQPGCEDIVKQQYVYITKAYPNSPGAQKARQRLNNFPERSLNK